MVAASATNRAVNPPVWHCSGFEQPIYFVFFRFQKRVLYIFQPTCLSKSRHQKLSHQSILRPTDNRLETEKERVREKFAIDTRAGVRCRAGRCCVAGLARQTQSATVTRLASTRTDCKHTVARLPCTLSNPSRKCAAKQSCPRVQKPDPTQPTNWLTQPNPIQLEKFDLDPTRPNPIQLTNLTGWCSQILSNRALNAST